MQVKAALKNLSIKFATDPFYPKAYFAFLFGGEFLGTAYIPLLIFLDSLEALSVLMLFWGDLALGIMNLAFGVHFCRKIREAPPALVNPAAPKDTTDPKAMRMQEVSPPLYFLMEISWRAPFIGFFMLMHYWPLRVDVYLWLFWIQTVLGLAGVILAGYFWEKLKKTLSPVPEPSPL